MKLTMQLASHLALAALGAGLAGCSSPVRIAPLGNGYEEVAHPTHAAAREPETMRVSFQYRDPGGRTILIWPSLYGVDEVIKGGVAIFVGDQAFVSPEPDHSRTLKPRLFAVQAPALPLDITDEILWRWSKESGKDFTTALERFSLVAPEEVNGRLELHLTFWTDEKDWPDKTTIQLDWNQVFDIMRAVKEKGTAHKDLRSGTPFLKQGF